jgi:hypothetical protein
VNWRPRNSEGVGDILGEKQHKYFMIGIVVVLKAPLLGYYDSSVSIIVVLEYLFKIRYSCSRLERDYFCAACVIFCVARVYSLFLPES